jgi:hypothetical protein
MGRGIYEGSIDSVDKTIDSTISMATTRAGG